ncbi:MAG: 2,3-bisphosphoglycerate-independent phosphoglycerate mutase, partial [Candidatus Cloacimonetes bacterium]|nr:2,3-bisphosphoglycerate-independent phosphoglycerate mutase [Candidatus Cloacimonadota bacterium]
MEKVLLIIMDGYGLSENKEGNAINAARTDNLDDLFAKYPNCRLKPSGLSVGLPEGVMGNSEVGHMNIGAGRIIFQMNTLIDKLIDDGKFYENDALNSAIDHSIKYNSKLHLFGLLSNGNVHSNMKHLEALLKMAKLKKAREVYFHAFMDGRDTLPNSGLDFMKQFLKLSKDIGIGKIATISGRYYAMDRDNRWDRIEKAYNAIVYGIGEKYESPETAIRNSYNNNVTDEFIIPNVIIYNDLPVASIEDNDAIIYFNYRADRTRQLTKAFILPDFNYFKCEKFHNLKFVTFTEYEAVFNKYVNVAFDKSSNKNILGKVLSDNGLKQLRLAETEKYAHVTFFFNSSIEKPFTNEDRILIPSPKVASYDMQPEMSSLEVKQATLEAISSNKYDFIVVNFANCDMVGHTGVFEAAVKAVEAVDKAVGEIIPIAESNGFNIIITADH